MKRKIIGALALAVILLSPLLPVLSGAVPQVRNNTRENITTLMLLRMTQVLDLTEEQTAILFPRFNRIEKEKMQTQRQIAKHLANLRFALREEKLDQEKIIAEMDMIKQLRRDIKDLEVELERFVEQHLSLEQQAKYLIFFQDFYRSLQEKLNEARRQLQQKRPPIRR